MHVCSTNKYISNMTREKRPLRRDNVSRDYKVPCSAHVRTVLLCIFYYCAAVTMREETYSLLTIIILSSWFLEADDSLVPTCMHRDELSAVISSLSFVFFFFFFWLQWHLYSKYSAQRLQRDTRTA